MLADLKFALRQLRRSPGFALTAILTLALGIGATTAIFTLVHAVLLRSLPVYDPATLLRVGDNEQCCENGGLPDYAEPLDDWSLFSYPQYEQFRDARRASPASPLLNLLTTRWPCDVTGSGESRDRGMANSSLEIPLQPLACGPMPAVCCSLRTT